MSNSWVYFAQREGAEPSIKIGVSDRPDRRVRELEQDVVLRFLFAVRGDERLERSLHLLCDRYKMLGEWFRPHPFVLALLDNIRKHTPKEECVQDLGLFEPRPKADAPKRFAVASFDVTDPTDTPSH